MRSSNSASEQQSKSTSGVIDFTNEDNENYSGYSNVRNNAGNNSWQGNRGSAATSSAAVDDSDDKGSSGGPRRRSQSHLLIVGDPGCG